MPERVQLKRTKGWKMPPDTLNVTRSGLHSGMWGNWAAKRKGLTGHRAVEEFRRWVEEEASSAWKGRAVIDLRGKNLACYCPLEQPCHADVLLELANA